MRMSPWRSPRFLLGLACVLGATALGGWLLGEDDGARYWAVRGEVRAGEPVRESQLLVTEARLGAATSPAFLSAEAEVASDAVWAHDLGAGALVPRSAWTSARSDEHELPLAVRDGAMPTNLRSGDRIDVWAGPGPQESVAAPAQRVLAHVRVVAVEASATGGSATVLVALDEDPPTAATVAAVSSGHVTVVRRS